MAVGLAVGRSARRAVSGADAALAAAIQDGMDGDNAALLQDAHLVGHAVHLDRAPRRVGHAVEGAVHGDHAVAGDHPPFRWTRVTAYVAAASSSLLVGVM